MAIRVLLLGQGLFLQGLTRLLDAEPTATVVGTAETWPEARERIRRDKPQVLIVDLADHELRDADLAPLLGPDSDVFKVVYLARTESRMIVHDLKSVADAHVADLIRALCTPTAEVRGL